MRRPVAMQKIAKVIRLIKAGMSTRKAAREAEVGLATASRIARGQHVSQFSESAAAVQFTQVPAYECPGCNRMVTTAPCVACAGRKGQ